jgi:hypothetical protein
MPTSQQLHDDLLALAVHHGGRDALWLIDATPSDG